MLIFNAGGLQIRPNLLQNHPNRFVISKTLYKFVGKMRELRIIRLIGLKRLIGLIIKND